MLDLVVVDGQGARHRHAQPDHRRRSNRTCGDAVVLATGGYGNVYYLSTNAKGCNATAIWRAHKRGALFANPCFTQIHPTCIPVSGEYQSKLTLMSESLRNDGRVWVPAQKGDTRPPDQIPEAERDYYLERRYPSFGNLVPRDVASPQRQGGVRRRPRRGRTGPGGLPGFPRRHRAPGPRTSSGERYGNLFEMYERITGEDPYQAPMRIYPAIHYTMGGLWVDYNLMTTIPGLYVVGEANFSDHGANRLGASALMQGLADGYFVLPNTIGDYLAVEPASRRWTPPIRRCARPRTEVSGSTRRLLEIKGTRSVDSFHRELGKLMWEYCGMSRTAGGLKLALGRDPRAARASSGAT